MGTTGGGGARRATSLQPVKVIPGSKGDGEATEFFFARVPPSVTYDELLAVLAAYGPVEHLNLFRCGVLVVLSLSGACTLGCTHRTRSDQASSGVVAAAGSVSATVHTHTFSTALKLTFPPVCHLLFGLQAVC